MPPEEMVADPIEETPVDTGAESTSESTDAGQNPAAEPNADGKQPETASNQPLIENGKPTRAAIEHLKELRAKDPKAAALFKAALFDHAALRALDALDLPLRALVYMEGDVVSIAYDDPKALSKRHGLSADEAAAAGRAVAAVGAEAAGS